MKPLISSRIEKVLQEEIFPDLQKGRKDFDLPHTKAVVYWMKQLIKHINSPTLNPKVLITAAYAHDWGYIGLFDGFDSNDPKEIAKRKPLHMQRGAQLITELLNTKLSNYFSEEEINQVAHLVKVHDLVEKAQTPEEKLIMEADTLGMLDVNRVTPTFSKEDNQKFITSQIKGRRLKHFKHAFALEIAKKLSQKRSEYYS